MAENPDFRLIGLKEKTPFLSNRKTKNVMETKDSNTDTELEETIFDLQRALDDHSEEIKFSILDKLKSMGGKLRKQRQ